MTIGKDKKEILIRFLEGSFWFLIKIAFIWFAVTQIFERLDDRLPFFFAIIITYFVSAYVILPQGIRLTLLILRKGRIPRFTRGRDGFYVDPVNIILLGTKNQLEDVFKKIGWYQTDPITIKSCLKMIKTFVLNKPYPKAPFRSLFLFDREQDLAFQEPIGNSPRKRHHVRFWGTNADQLIDPLDIKFWTKKQKIKASKTLMWVGAGSEDIGFGLTFSYQVSHKVNHRVDEERDYILYLLKKAKCIKRINYYNPGKFKVGKYTSDGRIAVAKLI